MKTVFNQLDDGAKLKIIKYNKRMQNKMNISLTNYKIFSGKYIIYNKNVKGKIKGKEFNNEGDLIFEGEYLNGERNGNGKEYNGYNIIIFEGQYKNGKRNGKGKEYNNDGYLIYDRYFLNGEKHDGKREEYYYNGIIKFKGEYLNGKKNGKVQEYNENGKLLFEGEYLNGKKSGKGKEYFNNKLIFEGEYLCEIIKIVIATLSSIVLSLISFNELNFFYIFLSLILLSHLNPKNLQQNFAYWLIYLQNLDHQLLLYYYYH